MKANCFSTFKVCSNSKRIKANNKLSKHKLKNIKNKV